MGFLVDGEFDEIDAKTPGLTAVGRRIDGATVGQSDQRTLTVDGDTTGRP